MRSLSAAIRALCGGLILAVTATGGAQAQAWLVIDPPNTSGNSISPLYINGSNTIAGTFRDNNSAFLGFVRNSDGTFATFDAIDGGNTTLLGLNANGDVAGMVTTDAGAQGFLRMAGGQITAFSVMGATTTEATSINDNDDIAGSYIDPATSHQLGFIRASDGTLKTFAAPDGSAIVVAAINNRGVVAGTYANGGFGFVRGIGGKITSFTMPGVTFSEITVVGLNNGCVVAGTYTPPNGFTHSFIRQPDGTIVTVDDPNASSGGATFAQGLNDDGIMVGFYQAAGFGHGFARDTNGDFVTLDAPAAFSAPVTQLSQVGPNGKMTGYYFDSSNHVHAVRVNALQTGF